MDSVLVKVIFLVVGAIIGILVIRGFVLQGVEVMYFDAILEIIGRGDTWSDSGVEMLVNSDMFAKTATGFLIGAVVGVISHSIFYRNKRG